MKGKIKTCIITFTVIVVLALLLLWLWMSLFSSYSYTSEFEKAKAGSDFQVEKRCPLKVVWVIRSAQSLFLDRVSLQLWTWISFLDPVCDRILFSSERVAFNTTNLQVKYSFVSPGEIGACPTGHSLGPCCFEALAITQLAHDFDFDWAFFIDDDVYVYPRLLKHILEPTDPKLTVTGGFGCGKFPLHGLCGGGGYAISQQVIRKLANSWFSEEEFFKRYMTLCRHIEYCDIVTGVLLTLNHFPWVEDIRLRPWGMIADEIPSIFSHEIASLHYYGGNQIPGETAKEKMYFVHQLFKALEASIVDNLATLITHETILNSREGHYGGFAMPNIAHESLCFKWLRMHHIRPGLDWGNMPIDLMDSWMKYECDNRIEHRKQKMVVLSLLSGASATSIQEILSQLPEAGSPATHDPSIYQVPSLQEMIGFLNDKMAKQNCIPPSPRNHADLIQAIERCIHWRATYGITFHDLPGHLQHIWHASSCDTMVLLANIVETFSTLNRSDEAPCSLNYSDCYANHSCCALDFRSLLLPTLANPCQNGTEACIMSVSLSGEQPKDILALIVNVHRFAEIYPGWIYRIYHDESVPDFVLSCINSLPYVQLEYVSDSKGYASFWRLLVFRDSTIDRFVVRDVGAVLTWRERYAVDDWIRSNQLFHIMRDHKMHTSPMISGLWGAKKKAISPSLQKELSLLFENPKLLNLNRHDQVVFSKMIYPLAIRSLKCHDSQFCNAHDKCDPFPSRRQNPLDFVGNDYTQKFGVHSSCSETCRPFLHPEWIYC